MFAYGITVSHVRAHCDPDSDEQQTTSFVSAMTAKEAKDRPSAKVAIHHVFFAVLKNMGNRARKTCLWGELEGNDAVKDSHAGLECSEGHFHCAACVKLLAQDLLKGRYSQSQLFSKTAMTHDCQADF